jgi:hypothetical protein
VLEEVRFASLLRTKMLKIVEKEQLRRDTLDET